MTGARIRRAVRVVGLVTAAFLPGPLKRSFLRRAFGFHVGRGVKIGVVFFDCRTLDIKDGAGLSHGTVFVRCGDVQIGAHAKVGPLNLFRGIASVVLGDYAHVIRLNAVNAIIDHDCHGTPDSSFVLGYGAVVTSEHRIDCTDRVSIGRCSMLAGRASTIWTHNRRQSKPVAIGEFCYVGSESRFAPGAAVADCSIVALGSVLMAACEDRGALIAGSPARAIRTLGAQDAETIFGKTRRDLPDQDCPWSVLGMDTPPDFNQKDR